MSLPVYSSQQIKDWDAFTIQHEPVHSIDLMERAATICTCHILSSTIFRSAAIFCGIGNNGGDGLVIARQLHAQGTSVRVFVLSFSKNQSPDFKENMNRLPEKIKVTSLDERSHTFTVTEDVVIDAIFGSGLNKEPEGWVAMTIDRINQLGKPVIAVDLPSGLFCEDNRNNSLKHVIKATQTISFQTPKLAFTFARYADFTGDVTIANIGLSEDFKAVPLAHFFTRQDILLKRRGIFSHKGINGFLLLIAGFENYGGAAVLSSRAAFRSGCAYVAVNANPKFQTLLLTSVPESLFLEGNSSGIPPKTTAVAIGPGLGTSAEALNVLTKILAVNLPMVIDADAINLLAQNRSLISSLPANSILTPHPGELERLIGQFSSPEETLEKQVAFSKKHRVFVIQKGAYSKITCPDGTIYINSSGNPGMATAGMGDVLTGIIGSLLAQGYTPEAAACTGTFLHGYAADLVKREHGENGMLASDIIEYLPKAFNSF